MTSYVNENCAEQCEWRFMKNEMRLKIDFFFSLRPLTSPFLTTLLHHCSIEGNQTNKQTIPPKNRFFLFSARLYYQVRPLRPLTTRFLFIRFLFTFFFTIFILIQKNRKNIKLFNIKQEQKIVLLSTCFLFSWFSSPGSFYLVLFTWFFLPGSIKFLFLSHFILCMFIHP